MTATATASSWARGPGVVVLEELEHAKARGARIYAEIIGYGLVGRRVPYHRAGRGRRRRLSLHGGGGEARRHRSRRYRLYQRAWHLDADGRRDRACRRSSGCSAMPPARSRCPPPNRRSAICLGAAGAVEAIFSALAIRDNLAPPTLNLDNPSVATAIDLVPHQARRRTIDTVLSNSFGFGGTNASLILRRYAV